MNERRTDGLSDHGLLDMVYQTEAKVTGFQVQLNNYGAQLDSQGAKLDAIVSAINRPTQVNYAGWATLGFGVLLALFTAGAWVSSNTRLVVDPLYHDIERLEAIVMKRNETILEFQRQQGYNEATTEYMHRQFEIIRLEQVADKRRLNVLEAQTAKNSTENDHQDEYIRDIDQNGSRAWVPKAK